jgi:hypothetical protein
VSFILQAEIRLLLDGTALLAEGLPELAQLLSIRTEKITVNSILIDLIAAI